MVNPDLLHVERDVLPGLPPYGFVKFGVGHRCHRYLLDDHRVPVDGRRDVVLLDACLHDQLLDGTDDGPGVHNGAGDYRFAGERLHSVIDEFEALAFSPFPELHHLD